MLDRVKNPAYTDDNRCLPCTSVNAVFAVTLVGVVAWAGSPLLGAISLAASAAVISLRGCLVPGTPTLTQRYLPPRAMAYFGYGSAQTALDSRPEPVNMGDRDRDSVFIEHGVLMPCDGGADLCLTDAVRHVWTNTLGTIDTDIDAALSESALVDAEPSEFVVDRSAGDFAVSVDGTHTGRWPSRETFLADATGAVALASELPGWYRLSSRTRGITLGELQLFLNCRPIRGSDPGLQRRTEATCYRTRSVTVMRCADCDASFIEVVRA